MIRVNFLKTLNTKQITPDASLSADGAGFSQDTASLSQLQKKIAINLFFILLGPLALYLYEWNHIPALQRQLRQIKSQVAELKKKNETTKDILAESKKLDESRKLLEVQIASIEALKSQKFLIVELLQQLQRETPPNLWLTQLKSNPTRVVFAGISVSDDEVTVLLSRLSKMIFFQKVDLVRVVSDSTLGISGLKRFELQAQWGGIP